MADVAALLERSCAGDDAAAAEMLPLVYAELRRLAGGFFRGRPASHTLQPTALVHEAFLRLVRRPEGAWRGRQHFVAVAAVAMRQILVDHARRHGAQRRGGGAAPVTLTGALLADGGGGDGEQAVVDALALDRALDKLAALSARQARIVELRYFGGLTNDEVAVEMGVSESLVEKEWRRARAWIRRELADGEG